MKGSSHDLTIQDIKANVKQQIRGSKSGVKKGLVTLPGAIGFSGETSGGGDTRLADRLNLDTHTDDYLKHLELLKKNEKAKRQAVKQNAADLVHSGVHEEVVSYIERSDRKLRELESRAALFQAPKVLSVWFAQLQRTLTKIRRAETHLVKVLEKDGVKVREADAKKREVL